MLGFLLLVSGDGSPLTPDLVASLGRRPAVGGAEPASSTRVWLSDDRRVGFVGWGSGASARDAPPWHVGPHGVTGVTGSPWRHDETWADPRAWARRLTETTGASDPSGSADLGGAWAVVRLAPDGTGWIAADALGAGSVHVARSESVVALSDRAGVAAAALGPTRRTVDITALAATGTQEAGAGWVGTRTVPAGRWLRITSGGRVELRGDPPSAEPADPHEVAARVVATVAAAARRPGTRILDLDDSPTAALLGAAVRATGTTERFRLRAVGTSPGRDLARAVAEALGAGLEEGPRLRYPSPSALGAHAGAVVARTEATVVLPHVMSSAPAEADLVVRCAPIGTASVGARIAWAEERILGGPVRVDPLLAPDLGPHRLPDLEAVLRAIDPDWDVAPITPAFGSRAPGAEHLGPLLLASSGAPAGDALAGTDLDLPALVDALRDAADDPDTEDRAWAALTATTWLGHGEHTTPVRRSAGPAVGPATPVGEPPTLVTGVSSHSLPGLVDLRVPAGERRHDALLGTSVDGPLADLVDRVLLGVGATLLDRPADLAARLASATTAPFAPVARELAARRGGVLADPRLGLLVPFWQAHVHPSPRLVLVDERPAELLATSRSPLPAEELLWLWIDVAAITLHAGPEARVVDPRDLGDIDVPEGVAPDHGAATRTLQLASVLDGLVRELDATEIVPLLKAITRRPGHPPPPVDPAVAPDTILDALGALWRDAAGRRTDAQQAARETAALARRVRGLEDELTALRNHPGVRLALRLPGGPRTDG